MGQSLVSRVQRAIEKRELLRAGERVGVAVSGGADSVALLLLLLELRAKLGVVLSVVHVNHRFGGKPSGPDASFGASLPRSTGRPSHPGIREEPPKPNSHKTNWKHRAGRPTHKCFP